MPCRPLCCRGCYIAWTHICGNLAQARLAQALLDRGARRRLAPHSRLACSMSPALPGFPGLLALWIRSPDCGWCRWTPLRVPRCWSSSARHFGTHGRHRHWSAVCCAEEYLAAWEARCPPYATRLVPGDLRGACRGLSAAAGRRCRRQRLSSSIGACFPRHAAGDGACDCAVGPGDRGDEGRVAGWLRR